MTVDPAHTTHVKSTVTCVGTLLNNGACRNRYGMKLMQQTIFVTVTKFVLQCIQKVLEKED